MNNKNRLGLINYEGDVLAIALTGQTRIEVYDQWNKMIMEISREELADFLSGGSVWVDSSGKMWNFQEAHPEARISLEKITQFLNNEKI